jgi:hypothetical protein
VITTTTDAQRPRLFKRYTNRKFYDTDLSRYVNLGEIAEAIRAGSDVRVLDNGTARDLTGVTLARILSREQKASRAGLGTLFDLIRRDRERASARGRAEEPPEAEDRPAEESRAEESRAEARAGATPTPPDRSPHEVANPADPAPDWTERFVEALLSEAHRSAWSARATATASLATVGHLHREARQRARAASEVLVNLARLNRDLVRMARRIDELYERVCELDDR